MDNLHWLEEIKSIDRTLVGDKAFFLSRVMQRGYPVVPGFVVPAIATHKFLESVEWSEPLAWIYLILRYTWMWIIPNSCSISPKKFVKKLPLLLYRSLGWKT
jgi:hypothetical protein